MILDFFNVVANLKKIPRQGWINKAGIKNPESVADHTFSMAVMAMVLSEINGLNSEKTIKMSLLHDLAESVTGDITPNVLSKSEKNILENNEMKNILEKLPDNISQKYQKLWEEYQENKSREAKFVHDLDKLEMGLQAKLYSKEMNPKHALKEFLDSANASIVDSKIKKILAEIVNQNYEQ